MIRSLLVILTLLCMYALVIEWLFQQKKSKQTVTTEYWSHRGKNDAGHPENSIAAFAYVLQYGLKGIEVDVFWDAASREILVTHDTPQASQQYPLLKEIFARFKDSASYWIDFKNLTDDNVQAVEQAISQLAAIYQLQGRVYLESAHGTVLRKIKSPHIRTLYWVQYGRDFPKRPFKLLYIKSLIVFSKFYGYTSSYSLMDKDFRKQFVGLPLYIFHANVQQLKKEASIPSTVRVQLVDEDYLKLMKP